MAKKIETCPVAATLRVIGKKYAALIIRDLLTGKKRFGELQTSLKGISPRTLSIRLSELEHDGIIQRRAYPVIPLKVEYSLTKSGHALQKIIEKMSEWGDKYKKKK